MKGGSYFKSTLSQKCAADVREHWGDRLGWEEIDHWGWGEFQETSQKPDHLFLGTVQSACKTPQDASKEPH